MKVMKHEGRTILTEDNGQPALVELAMRPATTAHGRIKAVLTIGDVPLPFAAPVISLTGAPRGFTPEFRLEMN